RNASIRATLDYWNDPNDVYAVRLRKGGRLFATLDGEGNRKISANVNLVLWRPGTRRISQSRALASSASPGAFEVIRYFNVPRAGVYYVQAKIVEPGAGRYTLRMVRR
nr:hypothetical protein [Actinomycetota bacterium]